MLKFDGRFQHSQTLEFGSSIEACVSKLILNTKFKCSTIAQDQNSTKKNSYISLEFYYEVEVFLKASSRFKEN